VGTDITKAAPGGRVTRGEAVANRMVCTGLPYQRSNRPGLAGRRKKPGIGTRAWRRVSHSPDYQGGAQSAEQYCFESISRP